MPATSRLEESASSIEAEVNYIDPAAPDPGGINDVEREKSTLRLIPHRMRIHDVRAAPGRFSLETTGFVCLERPTAVTDFSDPEQVTGPYFREAEAIVKDLTGADKVVVFGQVQRDGALRKSLHGPVFNAHVDYDVPTIRAIARRLVAPEDLDRRLAGRIVLINLWRPLEPVESAPLAVCDASTVERGDLIYGPIGGKSASGVPDAAGYNLAHNPGHRWCYVSHMLPGEVLVFKLCDTDPDRVQWTAHTSFEDPTTTPDARPRRSIELRTLAFLPA